MLFDYIAHDYSVQIFMIIGLSACYIVTMVQRAILKEANAERHEKRYQVAQVVERQIAKTILDHGE